MNWIKIIEGDYTTYPEEGIEVLVYDGSNFDVAYYLRIEHKWVKKMNIKDDFFQDFTSFVPKCWSVGNQ